MTMTFGQSKRWLALVALVLNLWVYSLNGESLVYTTDGTKDCSYDLCTVYSSIQMTYDIDFGLLCPQTSCQSNSINVHSGCTLNSDGIHCFGAHNACHSTQLTVFDADLTTEGGMLDCATNDKVSVCDFMQITLYNSQLEVYCATGDCNGMRATLHGTSKLIINSNSGDFSSADPMLVTLGTDAILSNPGNVAYIHISHLTPAPTTTEADDSSSGHHTDNKPRGILFWAIGILSVFGVVMLAVIAYKTIWKKQGLDWGKAVMVTPMPMSPRVAQMHLDTAQAEMNAAAIARIMATDSDLIEDKSENSSEACDTTLELALPSSLLQKLERKKSNSGSNTMDFDFPPVTQMKHKQSSSIPVSVLCDKLRLETKKKMVLATPAQSSNSMMLSTPRSREGVLSTPLSSERDPQLFDSYYSEDSSSALD